VTSRLNTTIASGVLNMNGALELANERKEMRVGYRGDAVLGSVRMLDKVTNDSFLRWSTLSAKGISAKVGAGKPRVRVAALDLNNFYARIILNSDGRLNLRDIMATPEEARTSLTRAHAEAGAVVAAPSPAATPSPAPTPTPANSEAAAPTAAASPAAAPSPAPLPAEVAIGRVTLNGGQINYDDKFIRPNYSANLTDVGGKIGSFGTQSTTPADVELRGLVNRNAPLNINGSINPLTPLAFVDLKAKAKDVELTDLSTYSAKYTAYPITKGTLTVDVHYLLEEQKLTAENHIVMDQLTFGDKMESPNALNLPIRLAVAILKNPQGQIDLHIPISGSLSDPQFSIGGVLWHAFVGLIVKAVSSPFNLIASAIGAGGASGENLNYVEFAPGWASITPAARRKLDTIAKALQARPSLHLNICGRVDPKFDREGLRHALVEQSVSREKVLDSDQNPDQVDLAGVQVMPDEYNKYLWRAYKAAKFDKPRDLLGLTKSLPPDEMKKLMLANTHVTDDDLKRLAEARADAVRKALSAKIDPARLHIVPPKLNADGIKDNGKTTRADLSLE
jgi:outer membrane protein OmpA-like peptidoglycan-associated protein